MTYVDGFVLAVPTAHMDAYRDIASKAGKIWMEHGALEYKECWGDDLADKGFCATFPASFGSKDDETIVFAYIVFKSREHRDEVNAKVMTDERMDCPDPENMPFDCKRMSYGGFKTLVEY